MSERWRKAAIPLAIHRSPEWADNSTGTWREEIEAAFNPEDIERFRAGYLCLKCWESQETSFPEVCSLIGCGYRMRDKQAADLEKMLKPGIKQVGPTTSIAEELDRLDDTHERRVHVPGRQILIPKAVHFEKGKVKARGKLHTF